MKNKLFLILIFFAVYLCAFEGEGNLDKNTAREKAQNEWKKVKEIQAQYSKLLKLDVKFKNQWKRLDERIEFAGTLLEGGNYHNTIIQLKEIKKDLFDLAERRKNPPSQEETKIASKKINSCQKDREKSYQANRARYSGEIDKAIRLFYQVAESTCLGKDDELVIEARNFIKEKKNRTQSLIEKLKYENPGSKKRDNLFRSIQTKLAIFKKYDQKWVDHMKEAYIVIFEKMEMRSQKHGFKGTDKTAKILDRSSEKKTEKKIKHHKVIGVPFEEPEEIQPISMDIWQSAWGRDFNEIDIKPLIEYLKKNEIKKINLNPGLPMEPEFHEKSLEKLQPLVNTFYAAGIERINYLYAELNYPIEYYAKFLHDHPGLKIDTIVDDSEFVDIFKNRFRENLMKVKKWSIKYSAFITLESPGNSGVSDDLRFWVLDNVDYPILMSYFGCTLEEQKKNLEKYLQYADRKGKKRTVGIGILLGSKKVGREVSCERLLDERQLQNFLSDLHQWARENHPSYRGIVIETNLRMPEVNIYPGQMD
jgi:hypothetical protein